MDLACVARTEGSIAGDLSSCKVPDEVLMRPVNLDTVAGHWQDRAHPILCRRCRMLEYPGGVAMAALVWAYRGDSRFIEEEVVAPRTGTMVLGLVLCQTPSHALPVGVLNL